MFDLKEYQRQYYLKNKHKWAESLKKRKQDPEWRRRRYKYEHKRRRENPVSWEKYKAGIYLDIINSGFPKDYQVLCMNCNWAKGQFGKCPHADKVR